METIKMYLDNMFSSLPKTIQTADIKNNMLANMEEKYNELKAAGKSENEAIGIVISEFGNIDELVHELGLKRDENEQARPLISREEATSYLDTKKKTGIQIGFGVFLCILAPALLILINQLFETGVIGNNLTDNAGSILGLIPLFILVACAVGIFIYSGMNMERYRYIEEEGVTLPSDMMAELQQRYDNFNKPFYLSIIIGVCLIVLSPISIFVTSAMGDNKSSYGVVILLAIVAVAVFNFIYFAMIRDSYGRLLLIDEYVPSKQIENKKANKIIGATASVVWPLASATFLFLGFIYNLWGKAWVIFPIVGILFGVFCSVVSIVTSDSTNE